MGLILDIIILVLFVIFLFDGFKTGAVKSLIDIVCYILGLLIASYLSSVLAEVVFNTFIRPSIVNEINISLQNSAGEDIYTQMNALFSSLPGFVTNTLRFYGINEGSLVHSVQSSSNDIAYEVTKSISPVFISLIKTILFSALLIVLMAVFKVFSRTLNRIFNLPLLKQINKLLGLVCGALKCVILIFIVCFIIRIVTPAMNNPPAILSENSIDSTIIFKSIYYNNPLYSALKSSIF